MFCLRIDISRLRTMLKDMIVLILQLGLVSSYISCTNGRKRGPKIFNVLDYGAVGDHITDDSKAFLEAWDDACSTETKCSKIIVPKGNTFLLHPTSFHGPCKPKNIIFQISGRIQAPPWPDVWDGLDAGQWLRFIGIRGLVVTGHGRIDGKGSGWWDQSCKYHPNMEGCTKLAPTAMKFQHCNQSRINNVKFINSAQTHVSLFGCNVFRIKNVTIRAPGSSPNTDGIHIQSSHYVTIRNSTIGTGDDCVSIGDYTSHIDISDVRCGPGHGISVGSLGKKGNYVQVEKIHVKRVRFNRTTNGARIKTWQVGKGYVRDIRFEQLSFDKVKNPIIIDQNYCNVTGACKEMETGVHVSNVVFKGLFGTSSSDVAINLNCSRSVACTKIQLHDIWLISPESGRKVTSSCVNAQGYAGGIVKPSHCLNV